MSRPHFRAVVVLTLILTGAGAGPGADATEPVWRLGADDAPVVDFRDPLVGASERQVSAEADSNTERWRLFALRDATGPMAPVESDVSVEKTVDPIDHSDSPFGKRGDWRWVIYGGAASDIDENREQYNLHFGASYFLVDDLSLNFELGGIFFDQPSAVSDDEVGGNFNILLRWHMFARETWSFYIDGGAGMILISDEIPVGGTQFNFTPQAGFGFSFDVGEHDARLLTGVRWHHISNARIHGEDDNPGRDSIMGYVGLSFPLE